MEESNARSLAALVCLKTGDSLEDMAVQEMTGLAEAAGIGIAAVFTQALERPVTGTYIGSGKIEEIAAWLSETGTGAVLFDAQLSPTQLRNLSDAFDVPVIDRTALILRIFAERARTREARLQVEYASLQYRLPRLTGLHRELSRQGGASGAMSSRGAGEKKLELDRRRVESRMSELRRALEELTGERETQRRQRRRSGLPLVALVGYTNAGKSTIMNRMLRLSGAGDEKLVYEEDLLFATLDTSVRRIEPGRERRPFLLSDTVGFIDRLPAMLVKAFRSTLEEAREANLIAVVTDLADPDRHEHLDVTIRTLNEIGAGAIPRLFIWNKADLASNLPDGALAVPEMRDDERSVVISAENPADIDRLIDVIGSCLNAGRRCERLLIPYSEGGLLSSLMERAELRILEYTPEGTLCEALLSGAELQRCSPYIQK